jgi:neopullulanase
LLRNFIILFIVFINFTFCFSQRIDVVKVEPPNWWTDMKWNKVQLMVYGNNLKDITAKFNNSSLEVLKIHNAESSSYSFIDIQIPDDLTPGTYKLIIQKEQNADTLNFPILNRESTKDRFHGFNTSDVIYLITPDRFADGDTSNDVVKGTTDEYNLKNPSGRHGGDIQGIINHLDYIKNLGATALWINPLIENNTHISYHGYSATNLYKIDPRFGTNNLYKKLVEDAHSLGLKVIMDHVSNHVSIDHPWIKDLPFADWLNGTVEHHQMTRHDKLSFADIHRDSSTIYNITKGWFTNEMPDLNQANPYVSNYLIQNTLWWIQSTGLDGIREDTYPYCDQKYLANWAKAILTEYPNFNIVGEIWTGLPTFISSFQRNSYYPRSFDSNLPAVTDYASYDVYAGFLKGTKDLNDIYDDFAEDFIYSDPNNLVTFIGNHDVPRPMYLTDGDFTRVKMALIMLLTSRGIPEIYYGDEIGIIGGKSDGEIRSDFPGGFPGDTQNAFTSNGRTTKQNEIYNFMRTLLELRKEHKALQSGKLIEFPPYDKYFVYFKISGSDRIMVIINNTTEVQKIDLKQYSDQLKNVNSIKNLISGKTYQINDNFLLPVSKFSGSIFQLVK